MTVHRAPAGVGQVVVPPVVSLSLVLEHTYHQVSAGRAGQTHLVLHHVILLLGPGQPPAEKEEESCDGSDLLHDNCVSDCLSNLGSPTF